MRNSSKIKLILLIFFIIFFGFLFWYFYEPTSNNSNIDNTKDDSGFNLFPFGDSTVKNQEDDNKINNNNSLKNNFFREDIPRLRQISRIPTAGIGMTALTKAELHKINVENDIFDTEDALKFDEHISEIRYVAKKNGHIYSTYTNTTKEKRVSNTTIQKVYDAEFWNKNNLIVRYLDGKKNIKTYSIALKEKTEEELDAEKEALGDKKIKINRDILNFGGVFLPMNIKDFSLFPSENKIFYLKREGNKTIGIISKSFGQEKKQVFESDLHEWNINWKNSKYILINSKPSSETYSLSFRLDKNNAFLSKTGKVILAGNGLPNNDFSKILYSGKDYKNKFHLYIYDIKSSELKDLGLQTLVDKCVWSRNNVDVFCAVPNEGIKDNEPDMWYKGYTDFSDSIYKINTEEISSELIFDSYVENKNFDISKIYLDDFEDNIYFVDGITDYAWLYKIR